MLMNKTNIAILGPMKNVNYDVGLCLSKIMDMPFVGFDEIIENKYDMKQGYLIDDLGCDGYFQLEKQILENIDYKNVVLSTTGTVFINNTDINKIGSHSYIVFLEADDTKSRVRINKDSLYALKYKVLESLEEINDYMRREADVLADIIIDTSDMPALEVAKEIKKKIMVLENE